MNQNDFSKVEKMNIKSEVIFANQGKDTSIKETYIENGKYIARMINTNTKGASKNRNILLTYADADVCMLADDDVQYYDGYAEKILAAFARNKKADMIIFNVDTDSRERKIKKIIKERPMRKWDKNPYGSVRVAFKLNSQRKMNIWFNVLLGPNGKYKSGEDTKFINDFRENGHVYLCPDVIGKVDFSKSTWFDGYTENYFFNQGAKIEALYGWMKWIMLVYYTLAITAENVSVTKRCRLMLRGMRDYQRL